MKNIQTKINKISYKILLNKYLNQFLFISLITISVISFIFYFSHGLTLQYNDATSHLDIARRITHSLTPGLVQIGSNWLPLLHLLEMPFAMNFFLWRTGLAGSIISMISFCISGFLVYKIINIICKDKIASLIGCLAFTTNGNMLYMQTAPMFEPLLIVNGLFATYYLIKWVKKDNLQYLILSSFFIFLATLTRYDGWFLFLGSAIFVFLVIYIKHGYKIAEGRIILFVVLSGLGIVLWFIYNQLIFGHWDYFMTSEFSARAQQINWQKLGKLPARHNIFISTLTYSAASLYNIGIINTILAIIGLIYINLKKIDKYIKIAIFLLIIPYIFNIISLYIGQSIIWVPHVPPYDNSFFNVRYGLLMVPAAAIFVGFLAWNRLSIKILLTILVLLQGILFYLGSDFKLNFNNLPILKDTVAGKSVDADKTATWINQNCSKGLILISAASYESSIFNSDVDMNHFITEGTGNYWKTSLITPSKYAQCVVFGLSPLDNVEKKMKSNFNLKKHYKLVQKYGNMSMYLKG